jgi:hypothetical protein
MVTFVDLFLGRVINAILMGMFENDIHFKSLSVITDVSEEPAEYMLCIPKIQATGCIQPWVTRPEYTVLQTV